MTKKRYIAKRGSLRMTEAGCSGAELANLLAKLGSDWTQAIPRNLVKHTVRCRVNGDGYSIMRRRYVAFGKCVGVLNEWDQQTAFIG